MDHFYKLRIFIMAAKVVNYHYLREQPSSPNIDHIKKHQNQNQNRRFIPPHGVRLRLPGGKGGPSFPDGACSSSWAPGVASPFGWTARRVLPDDRCGSSSSASVVHLLLMGPRHAEHDLKFIVWRFAFSTSQAAGYTTASS